MEPKKLNKVTEIAREACNINNVALYGVESKQVAKGMILLVYITRIGGVTVEDCKKVSRYIGRVLEEIDLIQHRYYLEVSSPGLERDLKLKMHYVSAIGENIKVVFNRNGDSQVIKGILKEVLPDEIIVQYEEDDLTVKFSDIKKAKTYFNYKKSD
jgi:ribosome maturation factor RimP